MNKQKTLILIDGHALAFRQYFALERTAMKTSEGVETWAVYGFFKAIFDLLKGAIKPDAIAVTFDVGRQTFRTEKFKEYKAQREAMPDSLRSQLGLIVEGLNAFNIPIYTKEGFEADDVIGTICKKASELGHKTLILTGDQDSFQLIGTDGLVNVLIPSKGELLKYDWEKVYEKLGVYPNQVADYKGLRGDVSDNIPGVRGIGEKTAQKLLGRYHNLEEILDDCENIPENAVRIKICEGKDIAKLSKYLATIVCDVDINFDFEKTNIELPKISDVVEFLKRMQFYSFVKSIDSILCSFNINCEKIDINFSEKNSVYENRQGFQKKQPENQPEKQQQIQSAQLGLFAELPQKKVNISSFDKNFVEDVKVFVDELNKHKELAIHIVSDFHNAVDVTVLGFAFAFDSNGTESYYVPLTEENVILLRPIFEDKNIKKYTYNLKNDVNALKSLKIDLNGVDFDVMLASYIKNPSRNHNLSAQSLDYLNHIMKEIELPTKKSKLSDVLVQNLSDYAGDVVFSIYELTKYWKINLANDEMKLLMDMEIPLAFILAKMEFDGVSLDVHYLHELSDYMTDKMDELEQNIYEIAGEKFNINSPKQVGDILYNKLEIKSKKKTKGKTSLSTSFEVLEELSEEYKICKYLIQYRKYSKLKSTYTDSLPVLINSKDHRIHTSYNQTVTTTGRLSSSNPNLQNIPIRTEEGNKLRQAFVAQKKGNLILSADYSQIELRLLAHVSGDENLIEAFNSGEDIHTLTASKVFEVSLEEVNKEMRYRAKAVNFGIIYGQSRYGLSKSLGISAQDAQIFIDKYFRTYPKVKNYMQDTVEFAYKHGFVETIFGRKRYLAGELSSPNRMIKEFAERAAINQPLQGTAADLIKIAMIEVAKKISENKIKSKMVMQVHDELVFEVKQSELEQVKTIVKDAMQGAYPLRVPLLVDLSWGNSWKE